MGIRSFVIIVACFGLAAAEVCSSDTYGNINAYPFRLQDYPVHYPNYVIQIPAVETCQGSRPVGVTVFVCAPYSPPPQVTLQSVTQAEVRNAQTETEVKVIVYCSPRDSFLSNSLPEPRVIPLGQQRVNMRRYDSLRHGLFNAGLIH